jgi:uncharacterized membrane protein SirB2
MRLVKEEGGERKQKTLLLLYIVFALFYISTRITQHTNMKKKTNSNSCVILIVHFVIAR